MGWCVFLEGWVTTEELQVLLALTGCPVTSEVWGQLSLKPLGVSLAYRAPERELYRQKGVYEFLGSGFCSGWGLGSAIFELWGVGDLPLSPLLPQFPCLSSGIVIALLGRVGVGPQGRPAEGPRGVCGW